MKQETVLDKMNQIAASPIMRMGLIQKVNKDIRQLSIWPKIQLEQIVAAERAFDALETADVTVAVKEIMGESDYQKSQAVKNRHLKLMELFIEKVKPILDDICVEAGFVPITPEEFNTTPDEFVERDKKEGWR